MLELGDQSEEEHSSIIRLLEEKGLKNFFLVGKEFARVSNSNNHFSNADEMASYFTANPPSDALILIKGSRGIRLEKVAEAL